MKIVAVVDVGVTQQFLNGSNVVAVLQQVCGEAVPEGMAGRTLRNTRFQHRLVDSSL